MEIKVLLPTPLRRFADGADSVTCSASTVDELLGELETRFSGLRPHLRDGSGQLRPFLNLYVNEEDVRFLGGMAYQFKEGDEVMLVPSIAGGATEAEITAVVPASAANLGCAFDCAALALNRYLTARVVPRHVRGFQVHYRGVNPDRVPRDESNLVLQAIRRITAVLGVDVRGALIEIENDIPVSAGLGASAAATVAGLLVGSSLCGMEPETSLLLRLAAQSEGHPDNAAAALLGGLVCTVAGEASPNVLSIKTPVSADLRLIAIVPEFALPTYRARAILPERYPRNDAVHNLQRTAFLVASIFSGRYELTPELFRDRLHQPYRTPLVPGLASCLEFRHPGLLGALLSGAGPTLLAIARHSEEQIANALTDEFRRNGTATQTLFLEADNRGAQLHTPRRPFLDEKGHRSGPGRTYAE